MPRKADDDMNDKTETIEAQIKARTDRKRVVKPPSSAQVGTVHCPDCGAEAAVYQNARTMLYVRCGNCGCDQRNGAKVQQRLWSTMQRFSGVALVRPANVPESDEGEPLGDDAGVGAGLDLAKAAPGKVKQSSGPFWGVLTVMGLGFVGLIAAIAGGGK
jgi:ribosomal protein S27E